MQIALSGKRGDSQTESRLLALVEFFRLYAREQTAMQTQGADWGNMRELSRVDGYRGRRWRVEDDMSYYRGGTEMGLDGSERSCMSLAPRAGTWEERLPWERRVHVGEIEAEVARGMMPPHAPHEQVQHGDAEPGSGPWRGDMSEGYGRVHDVPKREDPLTRMALRLSSFERASVRLHTLQGVEVRCGDEHREAFNTLDTTGEGGKQGCVETRRALARVLLPLHYRHRFTHVGAVDGSMDDPRREGGDRRKRVAYGVYEGILPESHVAPPPGGWTDLGREARVERCMGAGMWGGALPRDWDNNDAEAYAILSYLQSVLRRSRSPADEKVLVLSDSRAVMDVIERVWRTGEATLCKARDRGAMIEAICTLRAQLGGVVFVWNPGHRGVVWNEMADACAKAHLDELVDSDAITLSIASCVDTRDILYERLSEHADDEWSFADRRCYRLARVCMGRWVHRKLLENVHTLRYDAALADGRKHNYGGGGLCTEVVMRVAEGRKVGGGLGVQAMLADNQRVGFVMGRRAGESGLPHERTHLRRMGRLEGNDAVTLGTRRKVTTRCVRRVRMTWR